MCGKFFQRLAWRELIDYAALSKPRDDGRDGGGPEDGDTVTPMRQAAVLHLDENGQRRSKMMRWGFSRPKPGQKVDLPDIMHARAETIDEKVTFRHAFKYRRGLAIAGHFNVAEEIGARRVQHVVIPDDGKPLALAVLWEKQARADGALHSFVMITVEANRLIGTVTDRMPAVIAPEHWAAWLGEEQATPETLKALLKPAEGDWSMARQERTPKPKPPRQAPDLFEV